MKFQGLYCSRIQLASQLLRGDIVQMATTNENDEQANIFSPFLDRAVKGPKLDAAPFVSTTFSYIREPDLWLDCFCYRQKMFATHIQKDHKVCDQATV
jgi:hypothetical protein